VAERSGDTAFESAPSSKAPSPLRSAGAVHENLVHWQSVSFVISELLLITDCRSSLLSQNLFSGVADGIFQLFRPNNSRVAAPR